MIGIELGGSVKLSAGSISLGDGGSTQLLSSADPDALLNQLLLNDGSFLLLNSGDTLLLNA